MCIITIFIIKLYYDLYHDFFTTEPCFLSREQTEKLDVLSKKYTELFKKLRFSDPFSNYEEVKKYRTQ